MLRKGLIIIFSILIVIGITSTKGYAESFDIEFSKWYVRDYTHQAPFYNYILEGHYVATVPEGFEGGWNLKSKTIKNTGGGLSYDRPETLQGPVPQFSDYLQLKSIGTLKSGEVGIVEIYEKGDEKNPVLIKKINIKVYVPTKKVHVVKANNGELSPSSLTINVGDKINFQGECADCYIFRHIKHPDIDTRPTLFDNQRLYSSDLLQYWFEGEYMIEDRVENNIRLSVNVIVPPPYTKSETSVTETSESNNKQSEGGGCLIATATYGSELSPQVQQLRELRDNTLLQTNSGSSFMIGFNQFYYSFSPTIADWERQNPVFKEAVRLAITPLITSLSLLNYVDMDSEAEVLGYGIGLILLNIGMYIVAPIVIGLFVFRKRV